MGKKIISLILCTVLILSIYPGNLPAMAESYDSANIDKYLVQAAGSGKDDFSEKELEKAIKTAKEKIQIPEKYSKFDFYYSGTASNDCWNLSWTNPDNDSYINVNLDKDYNITYYYKYDASSYSDRNIPSYLKSELIDNAKNFIRTIAPDVYLKMEFVEAYYNGIYNNIYTYKFQRKENGIIFPDNTVTVSVDAETGEVISASIDWLYDAKITTFKTKITKEQAAEIIGKNLKMELKYEANYNTIYENGQYKTVKKAFLVYKPSTSYISVDANTGEVYLTRNECKEVSSDTTNAASSEKEMAKNALADDSSKLTEQEIEKIREVENLISKDKAIESVTSNPYLYIDKNLITYNATLNKSYTTDDSKSSYVWNIELRDSRLSDYSSDSYGAWARATVDAKTGKILRFYANLKSNYDEKTGTWLLVKIKYTNEQARKTLEKFLKSQINDRFSKTKLTTEKSDYNNIAYYDKNNTPVYGGYYYIYNRFNEGVEFPYNQIYGAVDGVTGKIYYYGCFWDDDITFESPKNIISPEKAFEYYISKDGFNLLYEVNVINQYDPKRSKNDRYSDAYSVTYEVRLVYRPDIYPQYISPFTGEQLNYDGEVYKAAKPYIYEDIENTDENREILILSDMDIGFEGTRFEPNKAVTKEEVNQLLVDLGYYISDNDDSVNSSKLITREELAYNFIKRMGLENISGLSGIYKTGYLDENNISSNYLGAVALARGLKIFPENENNFFNPQNNVTRKELVSLIFNFIKAYKNLKY